MRLALDDGGVVPEQIGYINAHGTSTHLNDSCETTAIKTVFGGHAYKLAVSSTKSMTGRSAGRCRRGRGRIYRAGSARCLFARHRQFAGAGSGAGSGLYPQPWRAAQVEYAMSDSLGFGGHNACVVFKRWEG